MWVPVSLTGKVSNSRIRDLGFNPCLHQKTIHVLIWRFAIYLLKNCKFFIPLCPHPKIEEGFSALDYTILDLNYTLNMNIYMGKWFKHRKYKIVKYVYTLIRVD